MTASDIISQLTEPISEGQFNQLVKEFSENYLQQADFSHRLRIHRKPIAYLNTVLQDLYKKDLDIQKLEALSHIDQESNAGNYVTSVITSMIESDKTIKTLYQAVCEYCNQYGKPLNLIAVHVAEYRSVRKLERHIQRKIRSLEKRITPRIGNGPITNTVHLINSESAIKAVSSLQNGQLHYMTSSEMLIHQYYTHPHEGYQQHPAFPYCCQNHTDLYQAATKAFLAFPDCCIPHSRLKTVAWFNKEDYSYIPLKVVNTVSYTIHCINEKITTGNWYKDITDYIDYTVRSYGQFPDTYGSPLGLNIYFSNIKHHLEKSDAINADKRTQLLAYVSSFDKRSPATKTDINLLIDYYMRWLKVFPFDMDLFKALKAFFQNRIPILKGQGTTNNCTQLTAVATRTMEELKDFLLETTIKIVQTVNTKSLLDQGKLTDLAKTEIDLLNASRQLEIENYDRKGWKDSQGYIKSLKKWFADERKYIRNLEKVLSKGPSPQNLPTSIVRWIERLQRDESNIECMRNAKAGNPKESEFQQSLKEALYHAFPGSELIAEELKGSGRIDIRVIHQVLGSVIIELKGWWNASKTDIVQQICSYITDFDAPGHIIIINDRKTQPISEEYKEIITANDTAYVNGSWINHQHSNSAYSYFETKHRTTISERTLFHYIIDVHASNPRPSRTKPAGRRQSRKRN